MRFVPRLCVDGYGGVGCVCVAPTESYKRHTLFVSVVTHRHIVGMIVVMHIGNGLAVLILGVGQGDPITLLRQIFSHDPHACHVGILIHGGCKLATPGTGIQEGGHERHTD